jgi:protein TonB
MAFKSLLLSKDAELVQTLARLLKDLDISVEPCSEPFAAAKRLMDQHFDAILVDCEDEQGAGWVLQSARMATASKKSITIAIVNAQNASRGGPRAGENFVIEKPIVLKQVEATLRAARGLMGDSGTTSSSNAPLPTANVPVPKPVAPAAAPKAYETPSGQGKPSPEFFDELSAVVEKLGPQAIPTKPTGMGATLSGSAAAAAPAREKPVMAAPSLIAPPAPMAPAAAPTMAMPEAPRPEPVAAPRPAQPTWPGLTTPPSVPPRKPELAAPLPLAASSAEMKPAMAPMQEPPSSKALDEARRRMETSAPPAWRSGVEERHEAPVPRFSGFAADEEPKQGGSAFKKIAIVIVLVSLGLFAYSWYRGHVNTNAPANQSNLEPSNSAPAPAPSIAAPAPVSDSHEGDQASGSGSTPMDNFGGDRTAPEAAAPATQSKPSKALARTNEAADLVAPDTTTPVQSTETQTDTGLPPAPLIVESGKRHKGSATHATEAVAPPSLDAVAAAVKPGLGAVVNSTPVNLPQLATAAPQRIRVSQGVTQGLLVRKVQPQYPSMARENRVEGDVLLEAVIGENGAVRDVKAISGPSLLIPPALQAVRQWRYKPYLLNSQPVEVITQIKLQFRL